MEAQEFKKLARLLSLPSGGKLMGDTWTWSKRGGHAGSKVVSRVLAQAKLAGWQATDASGASPDGSVIRHGTAYVSPEGHRLSADSSYGATKDYNTFSISLTLAPSAVPTMKPESYEPSDVKEALTEVRGAIKDGVLDPQDAFEYLVNCGYRVSVANITVSRLGEAVGGKAGKQFFHSSPGKSTTVTLTDVEREWVLEGLNRMLENTDDEDQRDELHAVYRKVQGSK